MFCSSRHLSRPPAAATGAAGLLGVPGTTSAVVDAQRAEQEDDLDRSLPEDYSTEGQPVDKDGYSSAALRAKKEKSMPKTENLWQR